jgi:hypothetical protein
MLTDQIKYAVFIETKSSSKSMQEKEHKTLIAPRARVGTTSYGIKFMYQTCR